MDYENNDIVILDLDRPRELKLTHKVMKRFCARTGIKLTEMEDALYDYDKMTMLIYEMLRADDPTLTPEKCDDLLEALPITVILQKGSEAVAAGFGKGEENEAEHDVPFER